VVDVCGDGVDNDCDGVVDGCCLGNGTLTAKVDYSAGDSPHGITTGDFDADGILDLAVVNHGSDNVSILLGYGNAGQGNGDFATKTDYTTGVGPYGITTGDFNSDEILDLAVVNGNSDSLSILLGHGSDGKGNGTFTTKVDYPTGSSPSHITTGDFNADGILDLAVVNSNSDSLSILLGYGSNGKGDGTFTARVDYITGNGPMSAATGDFDADGILDLAVTNAGSDSLSILLGYGSNGKGDGTFTAKVDYITGDGPMSATTGDFDADGILDLAVGNFGSNNLSILLGNGSGGQGYGTFAGKVDYPTGDGPRSVTTRDFNADGILDLTVMNSGSNNLSILLGNANGGRGDGTFATKVDYPTGNGPRDVASGDFNSDGILDLAVVNRISNNLSILLGDGSGGRGDGTFEDKDDYPTGNGPQDIATGDFNSDGILDLAVANYNSSDVSILLGHGSGGRGDGTFTAKTDYPTKNSPHGITSGDFNSDGILDLAVANYDIFSDSLSILLGNGSSGRGDGTFAKKVDYLTGNDPTSVTSGDFNSDGILDLAVVNRSSNNLSVFLGDGSDGQGYGTFAEKVDYPTGTGPTSVTSGDFNSDGILDLAVANYTSSDVSILMGNGSSGQGNGTFAAKLDYTAGSGPMSIATSDFNSDGILDLAVANYDIFFNTLGILLGNGSGGQGNGTFAAEVDYPTGNGPRSVITGDFNADGILDLATANRGSHNLNIFLGDGNGGQGNGTFTEKMDYPTGNTPTRVTTGDFNSDGILDLAVVNDTSDNVSILLGKGECLASP
jgi:surface antigen